jgi:hypothetical protein
MLPWRKELIHMKILLFVSLVALLAVGSAPPAFAQRRLPQDALGGTCEQDSGAAKPHAQGERALSATITNIDRQQGLLDLETEIGRVQMRAASDELQALQEGDTLLVCVVGEAPDDNLLQDSIVT